MKTTCQFCKREFETRRKTQRWCSHKCYGFHHQAVFDNINKRPSAYRRCEICGNEFKCKRRGSRFCGMKCAGKHHSRVLLGKMLRKPPLSLICKVCGKSFEVIKKRHRENIGFCSVKCSISRHHNPAIEKLRREAFVSSGLCGKFESNVHARNFHLHGPNGVNYHGRNIAHFVRNNPSLFTPFELEVMRNGNIRAAQALVRLRPGDTVRLQRRRFRRAKKQLSSWHGWTWISVYEKRFHDGDDLLTRLSYASDHS